LIALVRVEILKIGSTRMWLGLLLGAVALTAVGAIATLVLAGTPDGIKQGIHLVRTAQDVRDLVYTASGVSVFTLILGATSMTTEYRSGTIASAFLATPTRWPVVVAKTIANAAVGFAFGLISALIPVASAVVYFMIKGLPVHLGRPVVDGVLVVCAIGAYCGAIGAGVGAAIRSQLVAIIGVLSWHLIAEALIGSLVHPVRRWLPFLGTQGALTQSQSGMLRPIQGVALMVVYLGLALAVGVVVTARRDVV
jgi:ABC-2 type transport system permease protein